MADPQEIIQNQQDRIAILESRVRELQSAQGMDLKLEFRKAIEKLATATAQMVRMAELLQQEHSDERGRGTEGKPKGTAKKVLPDTPDAVLARGEPRRDNPGKVPQVRGVPGGGSLPSATVGPTG